MRGTGRSKDISICFFSDSISSLLPPQCSLIKNNIKSKERNSENKWKRNVKSFTRDDKFSSVTMCCNTVWGCKIVSIREWVTQMIFTYSHISSFYIWNDFIRSFQPIYTKCLCIVVLYAPFIYFYPFHFSFPCSFLWNKALFCLNVPFKWNPNLDAAQYLVYTLEPI